MLFIDPNPELDLFAKKMDAVKKLDESIAWEPTSEGCAYEFKTSKAMTQAEAYALLNKIKTLEKAENHAAYSAMESRTRKNIWRVIVDLDIKKE